MNNERRAGALLLVEDNPADAAALMEMAQPASIRSDYEVRHVSTLASALSALQDDKMDVVLLGLPLSDLSAADAVRALLGVSHHVPIVVLSSASDESLGFSCIESGAQDCLIKNEVNPFLLHRTIGYAVARSHQADTRGLVSWLEKYKSLSTSGIATSITAITAGVGALSDRRPGHYSSLINDYSDLLVAYINELGNNEKKPRDNMDRIVTRLGDLSGGPRDLLDVHVAALESAVDGASIERARALVIEGRLLALEMMGLLVDYYRVGIRRRFITGEAL
jgi:CheY-like chemotaxis protein